jgi:parallel beta-helix repeat protein
MTLPRFILAALLFSLVPAPAFAKQILVDDDKLDCPSAAFTKIQDAVNAASPGDEIHVCKGTYVEQVAIHKPLDIFGDSGAILRPSNMQQNSTSLFSSAPLAVALLVSDADGVSIEGLIVDGANNGISACSPDLFGIAFQNASGSVRRTTVRNFKLAPNLNGCQSGTAIFVQSGGGQSSSVTIDSTSLHDYQKNGITADEVGTQVLIRDNVVTGIGPTTGAAQNGIQIGFGADGSILRNTVSNNIWSPCGVAATCTAVATNILVTQSDGVTVSSNNATVNQVGIFIDGNSATVTGNLTSASSVFDGILISGSQNQVRRNDIFNAAQAGIFIDGNNNVVRNNTILDAAIGILKTSTSSGNLIQSNSIFDAPILVQDPPTRTLASLLSPQR